MDTTRISSATTVKYNSNEFNPSLIRNSQQTLLLSHFLRIFFQIAINSLLLPPIFLRNDSLFSLLQPLSFPSSKPAEKITRTLLLFWSCLSSQDNNNSDSKIKLDYILVEYIYTYINIFKTRERVTVIF